LLLKESERELISSRLSWGSAIFRAYLFSDCAALLHQRRTLGAIMRQLKWEIGCWFWGKGLFLIKKQVCWNFVISVDGER